MADSPEAIKKACKTYVVVFLALLVCTVLTVAVAKIELFDVGVRGFDAADAVIGIAIASVKASLVLFIFMHFSHEKKMLYLFFGMSLVFAAALYALTFYSYDDPIKYEDFSGKERLSKVL